MYCTVRQTAERGFPKFNRISILIREFVKMSKTFSKDAIRMVKTNNKIFRILLDG